MPKNCKQCGAEMPEEAHICLFCLTETEEKSVIVTNNKQPFLANKKRTAILITAAFSIIILVFVCISCFTDKNTEPDNSYSSTEKQTTIYNGNKANSDTTNDKSEENDYSTTENSDANTTTDPNSKIEKTSKKEITNSTNNTSASINKNPSTTSENSWSKWSTEKPEKGTYSDIETNTEYRYRTKTTTSSYATSLSGYTQNGYTLIDDTSGTIDYVDDFPSGFDKNNIFYKEYNKSPKYTSETSTQKTNVSTEIVGYLYWHWAYPLSGEHSEDDRPVSDTYNEQIGNYGRATVFEAFQSDIPLNWNSRKLAFHCTGHSTYSYWWTAVRYDSSQQLQVKRCIWTTQNKLYNYYKISDWSEWSTVKPSNFYDMETRTIYRYR